MFCFNMTGLRKPGKAPNIAYLLGSGLSIPFGLPNVCKLTKSILTSDQFATLHTDQCYHVGIPPRMYQPGEVTAQIATEFIRLVYSFLRRQTTVNRIKKPKYEDIVDLIKQYQLSMAGEYENPALSRVFLKEIRYFAFNNRVNLKRLLEYSIILIDCLLQHFLHHNHKVFLQESKTLMNVIPDFLMRDQINLFTLNHDLIIEDYLTTKGISFADGFYSNSEGLNCFDFTKFWHSSNKVRLVKLHGSIDRYYHDHSMIKVSDPRCINDPSNNGFSDNFVPSVLSGRIVKMLDYSKPIHADLYGYFRIKLATEISKLIVIGYGFGDKGINNALTQWFGLNSINRLIVVTFKKDSLINNARFAIGRILDDERLRQNRRVVIIEGGIEKLSGNCIRDALY